MERYETVNMASGGVALVLEPSANWEEFARYASVWADKLNAKRRADPIISVDECLLEVQIDGGQFWITYDDYQSAIHLEPKDGKYNDIVYTLQRRLRGDA
ncbi:MAG: hypothetical protein KJ060_01460 [Candidatus Hydrogenedentes bacterium]|nr:hypothetical protein [Candidatus Hydrogenedentota bacterium]